MRKYIFPLCFWVLQCLRFPLCFFEYFRILDFRCVFEYFRILDFRCVLSTSGSQTSDVLWVLLDLRFPMFWVLPDLRFPLCFGVFPDLICTMCFEYFRIVDFHCVFQYLGILKYAMGIRSQRHTIHNFLVVYHSWAVTTQSLKWPSIGWTSRVEFLA
jgi:hypothetical protein